MFIPQANIYPATPAMDKIKRIISYIFNYRASRVMTVTSGGQQKRPGK